MYLWVALQKVIEIMSPSSRRQASILLVFMVLNAMVEVTGIASLLPFVSLAAKPEMATENPLMHSLYTKLGFTQTHHFLIFLGLVFLFAFVIVNICAALTTWFSVRLGFHISHELSCELLARYLGRPYPWLLSRSTSDLAKDILDEIDGLVRHLILRLAELMTSGLAAGFIVFGIILLDPMVAVSTALVLTVLYSQIYRFYRIRLTQAGEDRKDVNRLRYKVVTEALASIKEARLPGRLPAFLGNYRKYSASHRDALTAGETIAEIPRYATETLAIGSIVAVLLYLVMARSGSAVALLTVYAMATWRLVPAVQGVYRQAVRIKLYLPALEMLSQELSEPNPQFENAGSRLHLKKSLQFEQVSFSYPEAPRAALHDLSLEVKQGSWLALIGRSGSGKTTLAEIAAGLLRPSAGNFLVDGESLAQVSLPRWWQSVGYVPQEVYLVDGSVTSNIALGFEGDEIKLEEVERAARLADIHDFIVSDLEMGYESVVGERGVALSGGQRQRLGIARALYHRPDLLILDEATAALDVATEKRVLKALRELETTVLFITHRLETVKICDEVALLSEGRLVYYGDHEAIKTSPHLAELSALHEVGSELL